MPYVRVTRESGVPDTTYLTWPHVVAAGPQQIVRDALTEPGVTSVELADDARSRILFQDKAPTPDAARRRRAALAIGDMPRNDAQ